MTPYDGSASISTQQPHNGIVPPPIPRPPPPPGVGLGSPIAAGEHSRHRQPPHMGMAPGPHRQQSSSMNYPLPTQLPPSPNLGGPNVGPPGPSPFHHPHHPSQQRHYSQQRHQQSVNVNPGAHGPQHGGLPHHPPQHSSQHHSHQSHPSQHPSHHSHSHGHSGHTNPSHHPPQHLSHLNVSAHQQQHAPPHHSQHHRSHPSQHQHPPPGPQLHSGGPPPNQNPGPPPISPPQHSLSHSGHSHSMSGHSHSMSGHPSSGGHHMRSSKTFGQQQQSQHHHSEMRNMPPPGMDQHKESSYSGLNGEWQSDKDLHRRRDMIQQIVKLLKQRDKNASPEWLNKLPQMVKQLEVSLYRSASSLEEYADDSTLKYRLQQLAIEIAKKTQQAKDQGSISSSSTHKRRNGSGGSSSLSQSRNHLNNSHGHHPSSQQQHVSGVYGRRDGYGSKPSQAPDHMLARRQHELNRRARSSGGDRRQVNLSDINPILDSSGSGSNHPSYLDPAPRSSSTAGDSRYSDLMNSGNDPFSNLQDESPSPFHSNMSSLNDSKSSNPSIYLNSSMGSQTGSSSMANLNGSSSSQHNKSRSDEQVKHKQQRLLILHHSYKCTAEKGKCPVTSHCADMKRLWKHMARCKDARCSVPHCFSSRSILSHYRECKDLKCPICMPVRESVKRSRGGSSSRSRDRGSSQYYPSHSSSKRTHSNGFGTESPPPSNFGMSDPSPYPQSHHSTIPGDRTHGPSALYDVDNQSPNRLSSSGGYGAKLFPPTGDHRGQPQSRSEYKSSSDATRIKHKQQRLLLLRHASKCRYEDGTCPHTEYCASMKKLWRHIADCKNQNCKVQHCISSRYVLTHYRDCKDPECQACRPVRESIKKSHERKKLAARNHHENAKYDRRYPAPNGISDTSLQQPINPSPLDTFCTIADSPDPPQSQPSKRMKLEPTPSDGFAPPPPAPRTITTISQSKDPTLSTKKPSAIESSTRQTNETPSGNINNTKFKPKPDSVTSRKHADSVSKNTDIPSLINCFTVEQIETHITSLNRTYQLSPSDLKKRCLEILKGLQSHPHGWVFNNPVDPVELGLHDYFQIIKYPMDLGTIQKRMENGGYHSVDEFARDTRLTFDNATTYNQAGSVVHDMACQLKDKFVIDYKKLLNKLKDEEEQRRKNERACSLCGCEKLIFEPAVFFCNGVNCQSKRIRRNSHYYTGGNNQYYWCNTCFNELDANAQIDLADLTIKKSDLKKKKNDEVHEESWVQCDECEKWIHQICGLFNTRQNKEQGSVYCCPECTIKKRKAQQNSGERALVAKAPMAVDLPRTKLSERLEKHVRQKVEEKCLELAEEKSIAEKCTLEEALKAMKLGGPVTIRQVTSTDRKLEVRERMKKRYAHKNYPEEFSFRCKCITVFQNLDGVDVLLFALYIYEHNEKNPPPNTRTVYISYLDSVHFMRPRKMRTLVYHEILICYLDYARKKGFASAHIWACPPLKGDDYIFYAKPEDQKTPRDARLRQWYVDMLVECQKQEIVGKVTNMYDLYFKNESLDATAVPYLDGDYFAGEVENVIKDLEEGNDLKGGGSKKSKKKRSTVKNNASKSKTKTKSNRSGTRTGCLTDEAPTTDNAATKSGKMSDRDAVMVKLGDIIQPMKASFIVAFLNWSGAKKEDMIVPKEIEEEREKRKNEPKNHVSDVKNGQRKRDVDGNIRNFNLEEVLRKKIFGTETENAQKRTNRTLKVIDDDMEDMDCEFFNNRQSFLDLCRGNHYQFDELRRAKHTSMMVLWHLHNRDAPKFVQQCASCGSEILTGFRHNCSICTDFDLCDACFKNPKTNRGACTHKLKAISVERDGNQQGSAAELEEQRRQMQRNIELHLRLLDHSASCNSQKCPSRTCAKMKGFLKHTVECELKVAGGCKTCKRLWTLLRYHAHQCKNPSCRIPLCKDIRVRIRQMKNQQQAMDDRRRKEMNRSFRNENR